MVQKPPKKRKKLPKDILEKDDRYLMECIFGKRVMKELDKITSEEPKEKIEITEFFSM
ncbi:MAG: hypothetical protein OXH71_00395 [Candidatus Dadabacteria bacterium]|nr:hypothetical protein [Candidatus Dadabacteria bacterium]MDE0519160.1 hypothetical protein [Candidatus Dadabacteria bacterium]MDE0663741.1 hypothetical protein [Candidatus Dadabacteria bacterium]